MLTSLKVIYEILENINHSPNNKEEVLRKHLKDPIFGPTLRKVLIYMIDKKYLFRLKKINYCVYFDDPVAAENQHVDGIFEMLEYLNTKTSDVSDEERTFLEKISSSDTETIEVVLRILNKFSGCGLINERIMEILEEA